MTERTVLDLFGHKPSDNPSRVFGGYFSDTVQKIRSSYLEETYDHTNSLSEFDKRIHNGGLTTEEFRKGHACFKYSVSRIICPGRILEIGVRGGMSALAFLNGCPTTTFIGVDNDSEEKSFGFPFSSHVSSEMDKKGFSFKLLSLDSQSFPEFTGPYHPAFAGKFDLIHVDGDHTREGAAHDIEAALASKPSWILLDDARDTSIIAAFGDAVRHHGKGILEWAYFEDTWTGNILIHAGGI